MAMTQRAKYMQSLINDAFGCHESESIGIFTDQYKPLFDSWMKGTGPAHLFVYYQMPYTINEAGEIEDVKGAHKPQFYVTDGEKEKLRGKGVYFMRCTGAGKGINNQGQNDSEVLFGEISEHTVITLNTMVNNVYKPLIDKLDPTDWGVCEGDQQNEFLHTFDKFAKEVQEALRSLQSNIVLEPYPSQWQKDAQNVHSVKNLDPSMVADFSVIFSEWSEKIEQTLDEAEQEKKEDKEAGPRQELEYWKQRMRKLTCVSEQLRSKNCTTVLDVLLAATNTQTNADIGKPRDKIFLATSKWRGIELRVTEALNEAKDNVKYLQTLEKFIEPLYEGNPESIKETLPALMNSIKMIHTIARYYNTNERMTGLFMKITNQMINNCKYNIINFRRIRLGMSSIGSLTQAIATGKKPTPIDDSCLWNHDDYPPDELIVVLQSCIDLHDAYIKQYEFTKARLEQLPKSKQFDFNPTQIFGKFDLFCRRVGKLMELFGTIKQFKTLEKHNLENISPITRSFDSTVAGFKKKNHKLLEFNHNTFDRDFVEFKTDVSTVETELQNYIDTNFENITNIEDSLKLLRKFHRILQRENLRNNLEQKYTLLFNNYSNEISQIEDLYGKCRQAPPLVRNLPTVSGSITWSRHLLYRIANPMEQFPPELVKKRESKKPLKQYNKIAFTLIAFETLWRTKWINEVEKAKVGLQATLIIRHPDNNKLYVNFDSEILTLIRETKCLSRIGIEIPEAAKIVLLQEDKFKSYNNELQFVLREYDRIVNKIRPNTKSLLVPHLEDLEYKLRPGMVTLTWTSMNIDGYLHHVHQGLAKLEQLIININDIMENRIENNLKALSKTVLVNLPQDTGAFSLDQFVEMQEEWIASESKKLKSKNYEVEGAVEDLIQTICSYQLDQHVEPISAEEIQKLSKYYNWSMYQALLHATKYSLNQMKERICGRRNAPNQVLKAFFEVDVHLDNGDCTLKPSLDEVQSAINRAASHVLKSTKKVQNWNQKDQPEEDREPFYDWIAKDKEIVKVILLLTGSIQGTKNNVKKFLDSFGEFSWLWTRKSEDALKIFNKNDPQLEDFEEKLKEFDAHIATVNAIHSNHQIGALSLKTDSVKGSLKGYIQQWKDTFSRELHKKAKALLENLTDEIKQIRLKIDKSVKDIDSLGSVMFALEEIRKKQSDISLQFKPITDMYNLVETYFADSMDKEESYQKENIKKQWDQLVVKAVQVRNELQGQQGTYKLSLIQAVNSLTIDVKAFRADFDTEGPMVPGLEPRDALERLRKFTEEFSVRKRKYDSQFSGEALFGLPHTPYPELMKTEAEIELLDKLYSLYSKVKDTIAKWKEVPWSDILIEIEKMVETTENFSRDCARLPGNLKSWGAYKELKAELDEMAEVLPLVLAMAKPSIQDRHWDEVCEIIKHDIPYTSENFMLKDLLDVKLLDRQEDIEEITENADKQLKLQQQLEDEICKTWDDLELEIKNWKGVDAPCTLGGNIQEVQEKLEEHLNNLNQMNAMKYVTPFKTQVTDKIAQLSDVSDIIEKWLKVQTLWTNLVSVFTSGDISKQMPTESKKFSTIHKQWLKIMERANEQKNVIQCCQNDILKSSLGSLQEGLEFCQKKLENYLETKRSIFPRFYFCSANDLLKILSQGSDPNAVQDDFEKLFDAINMVTFDDQNRRLIVTLHQIFGPNTEDVQLTEGVLAEGNIEHWLLAIEKEMQRTMKEICKSGAQDCFSMPLREFTDNYPSAVALLGIQMIWTNRLQDCLERSRQQEKVQELERKKKEIKAIMDDLSSMCLEDISSNLVRTKIETMVTIQVYQRDKFGEITDMVKAQKIKDANDFEWLKCCRVYWKVEENTVGVSVTDVEFIYQFEFLGVKERLCITPLTDRCYITLSQALGMMYGGAPAGPAGTGKTETVKDLGRTLGIFVVVTNCSDEHKFRDMAKIFKGVCQSGLWGCFDEFNRISLPTLSVVASQVESITAAKKQKLKNFMFPNEERPIRLVSSCAYFITMNPGYAGRQELPENLKVLFRGVTMMLPNRQVIMMVKLASVGYSTYQPLSKKFNVLYKLCEEQLSKQRHYDFGLRNILSVLRTAGNSKRAEPPGVEEEMIMARTLRDMNLSKFVAQDQPLFGSLISDIFPAQTKGKGIPEKTYKTVEIAIKDLVVGPSPQCLSLQSVKAWNTKIIQLYETSQVRHGFMLVGAAGCGKTTIMNVLTEALGNIPGNEKIEIKKMNPKAVTGQQMYGVMNNITGEWVPGVYSQIWKICNNKANKRIYWINCDGPVDAIWIENLNTVLDDNKILTLANAERIPMSDKCKMTFEVENLDNASPATVSRCGIIYVSPSDLSWEPLFATWCLDRQKEKTFSAPDEREWVELFVKKYIVSNELVNTISKGFNYVMPIPVIIRVTQMLSLLEATLSQYHNVETITKKDFEHYFIYCLTWSFGGLFETEERQRFHREILEKCNAPLPQISQHKANFDKETVFDYFIDPETKTWKLWQSATWTPPRRLMFSQLLIPTTDSTRADYIIKKIAAQPYERHAARKEWGLRHSLLVGGPGTAKTSVVVMYASTFDSAEMLFKRINFSSATTPLNFQEAIESEVERKQARIYVPMGGKNMSIFLDDLSMPFVNPWGDQITLEITRQLMDQKGFYFLTKDDRGSFKQINQLQFLAAMNHPGGGRNDIPNRLKRLFFSLNMTPPSTRSIENIYGRIMETIFKPKYYQKDIIDMREHIIQATILVWETVSKKLLPTPAKFHYVFTIRELARVFGGVCKVAQQYEHKVIEKTSKLKEKVQPQLFYIGLWRHECERTFVDKLINNADKKSFYEVLNRVTKEKFRDTQGFDDDLLMTNYLFCDFQREDVFDEYGELAEKAPFVYEAVPSVDDIRKLVNAKLDIYNETFPAKKMNLVIFDDALFHLLKICRIINTSSGNAMLVGVGGSGKQSLTKLSSFICQQVFFQIALTKTYGDGQLKEDIKNLYEMAGPGGKSVTFLLTDAEIKSETFLEMINSMLATGEIPGLHSKEDRDLIPLQQKTVYMKEAGLKGEDPSMLEMWIYFINRVKDCLHTVLCFSPVGSKFAIRAQKFPSLFSQCNIDWFLPWPEEALISVSEKFLSDFFIDNTKTVKTELITHMGKVHNMVTEVCGIYFQQMRRNVYVTPKSYLSFLQMYKEIYKKKYDLIDIDEQNINQGLHRLAEATQGVDELKIDLKAEDLKLKDASEATDKLLKELDVETKKADTKAREVAEVTDKCMEQKRTIEQERSDAQRDLAAALPYLQKAERAVDSIKPADITELKAIKKPAEATCLVMDTVNILFMDPLVPVAPRDYSLLKQACPFIDDSYEAYAKKQLQGPFLMNLKHFSNCEKDNINEETIELLEPYLVFKAPDGQELFVPKVAKNASAALEGLCIWCAAMSDYHKQSKIVKPKLLLLEKRTVQLQEAEAKLEAASNELAEVNALKAALRKRFDNQMASKNALQEQAQKTKRKMDQANKLINSLADNKVRWIQNSNEFKATKMRLVGNVAKACAFVSYCGPFNAEFRNMLTDQYFMSDLGTRGIPASEEFNISEFLVDQVTVGEWNLQGLPSDELSVQNGIMVTRSSRYPLMIDPQGQASFWIKNREPDLIDKDQIITLNVNDLRSALKLPMMEGWPLMIESIENEVDPMLDPLLEKQITIKGRNRTIKIADQDLDYSEKFRLYMTSRLANPHFSPELAAKTTIIDFTVTQGGLEQQLLARLISKEQKSLEEQLTQLQEEVTSNTKVLADYEAALLERLANAQGSLLDDVELIDVLATIKLKSKEVNEKLTEASEKTKEIGEKRELFRPVAARGSVLYFCVVEMIQINWMYNTSLPQFLTLYDYGIDKSAKAPAVKDRVNNIILALTRKVYRYINRGLFERDKVTFKLMMCMKILIKAGVLTSADVGVFLKAGAGIDDRNKKYNWMDQKTWLNIVALSKHKFGTEYNFFFKDLPERIARLEKDWKKFFDENEPENTPIPDYEDKVQADQNIGHFLHLCLIRSCREDRTVLACNKFIRKVLGDEYTSPVTDQISEIWEESTNTTPVLYLLSAGADPTNSIDDFARKKKKPQVNKVSMGEEQEKPALEMIKIGQATGVWLILNNCHLSLEFMATMEEVLLPKGVEVNEEFRLWITCAPDNAFPLGLLQMAIKVTIEPPKGLQAGLARTFSLMVNQDFLEKVEPYDKWRSIVFSLCFMHSIVQERRKFGALGFCIPYEFNNSDMEASLGFIEKHMNSCAALGLPLSWKAVQYMTCDVQYGGKITDDLDRELFIEYGRLWLQEPIFTPNYSFNTLMTDFVYMIPDYNEHSKFVEYITSMPEKDHPLIFGLNGNADLTYRLKESMEMIAVLVETQPKESGSVGGKSREEEVKEKLENELIKLLPPDFHEVEIDERIKPMRGPKGLTDVGRAVPLNTFLFQELQRFQLVLGIVRRTMSDMVLAIDGQIIMTPDIVDAINSISDFRVPRKWQFDPTGVEISWMTPGLAAWLKGLLDRHHQLNNWLFKERPQSFWLTGFFNPQGFLTAMKQEVTRQKKAEGWSLDEVDYKTEVLKDIIGGDDGRIEGKTLTPPSEGVLVHGLFLEGCQWNKADKRFEEQMTKDMFFNFPILHVSAESTNITSEKGPAAKKNQGANKQDTHYFCPVYKYPKRNDRYLIFRAWLKADPPANSNLKTSNSMSWAANWKLKGVCLLCCKE